MSHARKKLLSYYFGANQTFADIINMKKTETIDLIKGTFTPAEARNLLLDLLNSKINFHNKKNWSSRERFGKPDVDSEQKLQHLRESRSKVETLFSKLINEDNEEKSLTLNSTIEIIFE